jgi:hypothetical protein
VNPDTAPAHPYLLPRTVEFTMVCLDLGAVEVALQRTEPGHPSSTSRTIDSAPRIGGSAEASEGSE